MPPTDPLIYRFYEWSCQRPDGKAMIEEEYGDGIMLSAIDSTWRSMAPAQPEGRSSSRSDVGKFCRKIVCASGNVRKTASRRVTDASLRGVKRSVGLWAGVIRKSSNPD